MIKQSALALLAIAASTSAMANEFEVAQENKAFTVDKLTVKVGDTVKFPNHDSVHHNVFSLSEIKTFDLGSYGKGESKSVVFDKPGTVEVECAIHPSMMMTIEVTE
ncbi:MAG: plastocyanin/azurin family copper-binding protein [bacterium]